MASKYFPGLGPVGEMVCNTIHMRVELKEGRYHVVWGEDAKEGGSGGLTGTISEAELRRIQLELTKHFEKRDKVV
jgi:hypothetical protein